MTKVLEIAFLAVVLAGCAMLTPSQGPDVLNSPVKRHPQEWEKKAKEALQAIVAAWKNRDAAGLRTWDTKGLIQIEDTPRAPSSLDVSVEAVWIRKSDIVLRISWCELSQEAVGSQTTRHMANMTFLATDPMTLEAIEGANPFDGVRALPPRAQS